MESFTSSSSFKCLLCKRKFARKFTLKRHLNEQHDERLQTLTFFFDDTNDESQHSKKIVFSDRVKMIKYLLLNGCKKKKKENENNYTFSCETCCRKFKTEKNFLKHKSQTTKYCAKISKLKAKKEAAENEEKKKREDEKKKKENEKKEKEEEMREQKEMMVLCNDCNVWVKKQYLANHKRSTSHLKLNQIRVGEKIAHLTTSYHNRVKEFLYEDTTTTVDDDDKKNEREQEHEKTENIDFESYKRSAKNEIVSLLKKELKGTLIASSSTSDGLTSTDNNGPSPSTAKVLRVKINFSALYSQPAKHQQEEEEGKNGENDIDNDDDDESNNENCNGEECVKNFNSSYHFLHASDLDSENDSSSNGGIGAIFDEMMNEINTSMHESEMKNSGWSYEVPLNMRIQVIFTNPIGGCNGGCGYLFEGKELKRKKAIINIENTDENCFLYCLILALYRHLIPDNEITNGEFYSNNLEINQLLDGIDDKKISFPPTMTQIDKLEKINAERLDFAINIYTYEKKEINILKISKRAYDAGKIVNLLLLQDDVRQIFHYTLIVDLKKLCKPQCTRTKSSNWFLCERCLTSFSVLKNFEFHQKYRCDSTRKKFPSQKEVKFDKIHTLQSVPAFFICDFECALEQHDDETFHENDDLQKKHDTNKQVKEEEAEVGEGDLENSFSLMVLNDNNAVPDGKWHNPSQSTKAEPTTISSKTTSPLPQTQKLNSHRPVLTAFRMQTFYKDEYLNELRIFEGPHECMRAFFVELFANCRRFYYKYLRTNHPLIIPPWREKAIQELAFKQKTCRICRRKFSELLHPPIHDHNHLISEEMLKPENQHKLIDIYPPLAYPDSNFRFFLCNDCNLSYQQPRDFKVIFFNGGRYDFNLCLEYLTNCEWVNWNSEHLRNLKILPHGSSNKYLMFSLELCVDHTTFPRTYVTIKFIDAIFYCQSSLDAAAKACSLLPLTKDFFQSTLPLEIQNELHFSKLCFPYELITSWSDLLKPLNAKTFPTRQQFYSSLKNDTISEENYRQTRCLFNALKFPTYKEWFRYYLKVDIFLLNDVINNLRFKTFHLNEEEGEEDDYEDGNEFTLLGADILHYLTLPSYTFSSFIQSLDTPIEYIMDPDIYNLFQNALHGGLVQGTKRIVEANNPLVSPRSSFDATKSIKYLLPLDIVSLYSHCLTSFAYPSGDYKLINDAHKIEEIAEKILPNVTINDETGYSLVCDFEFTNLAHRVLQDCNTLTEKAHMRDNKNVPKLVTTLYDKTHYFTNALTLKFHIDSGFIRLRKIHTIISYTQKFYLKRFIEKKVKQRARATNDFDKNHIKLMCNSIYGRCGMRTELFRNVLVLIQKNETFLTSRQARSLNKFLSSPLLKNVKVLSEHCIALERAKTTCDASTLVAVACNVLQFSKLHLLQQILRLKELYSTFSYRLEVIYVDTDGINCEITLSRESSAVSSAAASLNQHPNPYQILAQNHTLFDLASFRGLFNIPSLYHKLSGRWQSDTENLLCKCFIYVAPKCYGLLLCSAAAASAAVAAAGRPANSDSEIKREKLKAKGVSKYLINKLSTDHYLKCVAKKSTLFLNITRIQCFDLKLHTIRQRKIALRCENNIKRYFLSDSRSLPFGHYSILDVEPPFEIENIFHNFKSPSVAAAAPNNERIN